MKRSFLLVSAVLLACGGSDETSIPDAGTNDASTNDGATNDGSTSDAAATDGATNDAADGATVDAGPKPPLRLFVAGKGAGGSGVFVWNDPDSITSAVAPTTTLSDPSVSSGTLAVATLGKRLFVATEATSPSTAILIAFDGADTITGAAAPAAKIPASQFVGTTPSIQRIYPDAATDTVFTNGFAQGAQLFTGASTMTSSATAKAKFTHAFQQTPGLGYDATGNRLFLGQISGAGLLAWNAAGGKTGTPANDFATTTVSAWSIAIAQNRMYATGAVSGGDSNAVMIWTNVAGFTASTAPSFTMSAASGLTGFLPDVIVKNDVMVVTQQANKVSLFAKASALTGNVAATATAATNLAQPKRSLLSNGNHLYVLDGEGIAIFKDATTTPTFVAKLKVPSGTAADIALLE